MIGSVQVVHALEEVEEQRPTYLAIGSFDGVHLGHQDLIGQMVGAARAEGARAAVLTFFPHPRRVVQGLIGRYYLTTLAQREALLAGLGVDLIIVHPFDDEVRHTPAADFVDSLCRHLALRQLWGGDFALGYNREGDVPFLRRLGEEKGYTVQLVEAMVEQGGAPVSSRRIRQSLAEGDVADANACLGRPYRLSGPILQGDQRGRAIGFPTANLDAWEEQILPGNGVYATYAWVDERRYAAATNVGVRPTVDGRALTVEAHLLDFDGDLYGKTIDLDFIARMRPEQRFNGLEALIAQIRKDVDEARRLLEG